MPARHLLVSDGEVTTFKSPRLRLWPWLSLSLLYRFFIAIAFVRLGNPNQLVSLYAEPPARMAAAILNGALRILFAPRAVHRLQEKVFKGERFEALGLGAVLRVHQLELVTLHLAQRRARLGTDAQPIDVCWRALRAVGLDRDLEALVMQRVDRGVVELQQGFAAGAHDEGVLAAAGHGVPGRGNRACQLLGVLELATADAIGADKLGVAKLADGAIAMLFAPTPQVATGETAEHRRAADVHAFALQGVEDLFD